LVFLAAFAWLGIDAAAEECETPFTEKRENALDMDTFCLLFMATALQEIRDKADDEIEATRFD
jgi:predicted membrane chloride channel (bestrophin family)